ncbi:MAG: hypothetical protein JXX29_13075 [Deltaproteobacteria bacterium]|nr:hypothetical protein [Deltaproteobacteria bacterium]MBN2672610.1 hypothetical protein [Deltaproteobacteria bacterium]
MKVFRLFLLVFLLTSLCGSFGCGGSTSVETETASAPQNDTPGQDVEASAASDTAAIPPSNDASTGETGVDAEETPPPSDTAAIEEDTQPSPEATTSQPPTETTKAPPKNPKKQTATSKKAIAPPPRAAFPGHGSYTFLAKNGNVSFSHSKHKAVTTCVKCHHNKEKGEMPPACRSCHGKGKGAAFKDVSHKLCKNCHQQKDMSTGCTSCHQK